MQKELTKHKYNRDISATYQLYSEYYMKFWKRVKQVPPQSFPIFSTIHQPAQEIITPKIKTVPVRNGKPAVDADDTIIELRNEMNQLNLTEMMSNNKQDLFKKQKSKPKQQTKQPKQQPKMILSQINGLVTQSILQTTQQFKQSMKQKQILTQEQTQIQNKLQRHNSTKQVRTGVSQFFNQDLSIDESKLQQKQHFIPNTNDTRTEPPSKQQSNDKMLSNFEKAVTSKDSQSQIDDLKSKYAASQRRAQQSRLENQKLKQSMDAMRLQMQQQQQMMAQIMQQLRNKAQ